MNFTLKQILEPIWPRWQARVGKDLFWSLAFHQTIEAAPPDGITPFYLIIAEGGKDVGVAYFQLKHLRMRDALKLNGPDGITKQVKTFIRNRINFYSLVCGNSMVTGQYGFKFVEGIDLDQRYAYMMASKKHLVTWLKESQGIDVGPFLCKDYFEHQVTPGTSMNNCTPFKVQPSMIFTIEATWKSFDDYLSAMRTKYRTRVKRAFKKLSGIERRDLNLEDLISYKDDMYALYEYVARQASFNLFFLSKEYFYQLKLHLGEQIHLVGYFKDGRLVGFYTILVNQRALDAHFLGYNPDINQQHQLYLNMLYDMIKLGIEGNFEKIFMSRTALEIKSSTGAEAHQMWCYLSHENKVLNSQLPRILGMLTPQDEWTPRNPFKDDE